MNIELTDPEREGLEAEEPAEEEAAAAAGRGGGAAHVN